MHTKLFLFGCWLTISLSCATLVSHSEENVENLSKFERDLELVLDEDEAKELAERGNKLTFADDEKCNITWFKRVPCNMSRDVDGSTCGFKCRKEGCCSDAMSPDSKQCFKKDKERNPCHRELRSSCYVGVNEDVSWDEAEKNCEDKGGHLVDINDQDENDIVQEIAQDMGKDVYIAGNDKVLEDTWRWASTNGKFYYTNWGGVEPNNANNEDCAVLLRNDGKWMDAACSRAYASVCELKTKPPCDHELGSSCYVVVADELTWEDAVNKCRTINGELVVISNSVEDKLVYEVAKALGKNVHIGANDRQTEGEWRWESTDELLFYNNWYTGEPDSAIDDEDCAYMGKESLGTWYDGACSTTRPLLCEINGEQTLAESDSDNSGGDDNDDDTPTTYSYKIVVRTSILPFSGSKGVGYIGLIGAESKCYKRLTSDNLRVGGVDETVITCRAPLGRIKRAVTRIQGSINWRAASVQVRDLTTHYVHTLHCVCLIPVAKACSCF